MESKIFFIVIWGIVIILPTPFFLGGEGEDLPRLGRLDYKIPQKMVKDGKLCGKTPFQMVLGGSRIGFEMKD